MATAEASPATGTKENPKNPYVTDGGDAALAKRGNAKLRAALEDENRQYDPHLERAWEGKYKFFSGKKMKTNFRIYARARHDPFNKDPSWNRSVLSKVAEMANRRNVSFTELFRGIDVDADADGRLSRPELKKLICTVCPSLSDGELTALFDTMDVDRSGYISIDEFLNAMAKENVSPTGEVEAADREAMTRWRNPVHRVARYPPARPEGWDHLTKPPEHANPQKLVDQHVEGMMARLADCLQKSKPTSMAKYMPKYKYFSGGADKFNTQQWKTAPDFSPGMVPESTAYTPRPGWMIDETENPTAEQADFDGRSKTPRLRPPKNLPVGRHGRKTFRG